MIDTMKASPRGNPAALFIATLAFGACFFAWSLLGPLGPDLQDELGLSDLELSVMVSVPVLLGSLARIPLGILADRHGSLLVFTLLMAWTVVPLVALALAYDSFAAVLVLGFLLGFAGASFAVGVVIVTGMLCTLTSNLGEEIHYRETGAPYFRSLFAAGARPEHPGGLVPAQPDPYRGRVAAARTTR